jgi:mono/diheme cytochrome c family protein
VETFLAQPYDLRPHLEESMPHLPLSEADRRDIASFLAPSFGDEPSPAEGSPEQGARLFVDRGCLACHVFTGADVGDNGAAPSIPVAERAHALAPDLRYTRHRFLPNQVIPWLLDPQAIFPDAEMPNFQLSEEEAQDLAAFILRTPLEKKLMASPVETEFPAREGEIFFEEVRDKVFRRTCYHCHSDPDFSLGDTGPGNEGGFGFLGVGLNLATFEGVLGGAYPGGSSFREAGKSRERAQVVNLERPEASRLVHALRARQVEERGGSVPGVRGMPLALPALSDEEIALVEGWIRQGAR